MRIAALALLCGCLPDPRGRCSRDLDCTASPGLFCAEGICKGPPRGTVEPPSRAFARGETAHIRARVERAHGTPTARVVFGGAAVDAQRDPDGAFGADVPMRLAPAGVEGTVPFSVELRDDLGHVTALPGSIVVDDLPPRLTVNGAPAAAVLRGTKVPLRVTAQDLGAVTVVNGTKNADGTFTVLVDTRTAPPNAAVFDFMVSASDAVGNVAIAHALVPITRLKFSTSVMRPITSLVLSDAILWALADQSQFALLHRTDGAVLSQPLSGGTAFPQLATDGTRLFFARSDNQLCRIGADGVIQFCRGPEATMTAGPILMGTTAIVSTNGTSTTTSSRLFAWSDDGAAGNVVGFGPLADFVGTSPAVGPDGLVYSGATKAIVVAKFDGLGWVTPPQVTAEGPAYKGQPAFRTTGAVLLSTGPVGDLDTFTFIDPFGKPAPVPTTIHAAAVGVTISSPTIAADGTAVVTTDDRHAIALRPDGSIRWTISLPDIATAPPSHGAGDIIYIGTLSGDILALALNDGSTIWSYNAGAPVRGPLAPGCDGILYASTDGAVVALVIDAPGLADSPWPRAAHDVRGTGDARRPMRSASGACLE